MEGSWRDALMAGVAVACAAVSVGGCGSSSGSDSGAIETADPAATFAPLVQVDADERLLPMGARWFLERAILYFAEDEGCDDRKIAVGRTLKEQHTEVVDWIYAKGLGKGPTYSRNPYDAKCAYDFDREYYADQATRPYGTEKRAKGARPGEGFYVDLVDGARAGEEQSLARGDGGTSVTGVPAYHDVRREDVDGEPGLRISYWMLYGMHRWPAGDSTSTPAHEGDWERVDVLLREGDEDGSYEPVSLRLHRRDSSSEVPWGRVGRSGTHPVLRSAPGSHTMTSIRETCANCVRWETWRDLVDARRQLWYGFGGAWGEVDDERRVSGGLGPGPD
jgi:hypothetical protein